MFYTCSLFQENQIALKEQRNTLAQTFVWLLKIGSFNVILF